MFLAFLTYMTVSDYRPKESTVIATSMSPDTIPILTSLNFLTWNIGYAGLDSSMDFFYDGGTQVQPTKEKSFSNFVAISQFLEKKSKKVDFFLIEEIDKKAKRSYYLNQVDSLDNLLKIYNTYFSTNYNVNWVPIPIQQPMGQVLSGICLYSKYKSTQVKRYSFPCNFSWPLKVFMLDRCFLVSRYPTNNGKELVVIVTHNSAFDDDGYLRKVELDYFSKFLLKEYKKGNYVIAGGDFNQCPSGFKSTAFGSNFDYSDYHTIPASLFPSNWQYVYDKTVPSNRRVIAPYDPKSTKVTLIDFYIISPNVSVEDVQTTNLRFSSSDHNPVSATFKLKK